MTETINPGRTQPRRLLLALRGQGLPTMSLRRALSRSRLLEAELHVLRVSPRRGSSYPMFPHLTGLRALEAIGRQVELMGHAACRFGAPR